MLVYNQFLTKKNNCQIASENKKKQQIKIVMGICLQQKLLSASALECLKQ